MYLIYAPSSWMMTMRLILPDSLFSAFFNQIRMITRLLGVQITQNHEGRKTRRPLSSCCPLLALLCLLPFVWCQLPAHGRKQVVCSSVDSASNCDIVTSLDFRSSRGNQSFSLSKFLFPYCPLQTFQNSKIEVRMKLSTTVKIFFFLKLQDFAGLRRHQGRSE